MEWREQWIRVAGHAKRIKEGGAHRWRCFAGAALPEIPIRSFRIAGDASPANVVPGTDPGSAGPLGLAAWIDFYGDLRLEDDVAVITLRQPPGI